MIEQLSTAVKFVAFFVANKVGAEDLAVYVDVRAPNGDLLIYNAAATVIGGGLYSYTLTSDNTANEGEYVAVFKTADANVDQQHLPALWVVGRAGVENLDAPVSGVAQAVWDVFITVREVPILISLQAKSIMAYLYNAWGLTNSTALELFAALMNKSQGVPQDIDDLGGTFNPATDSLEAAAETLAALPADVDTQLSGTHGAGPWESSLGAGAIGHTLTLTVLGNPVDGAEVWVTTDVGGGNTIASSVTDALGRVTFYLDAGAYYAWWQHAGYNPTNPTAFTVS